MSRFVARLRDYPFLAATLAVIAAAGVLSAVAPAVVPWLLSVFGGAMALRAAVTMVRELRKGTFGVDILAVTAITATIAVGEYWAAVVIVLMLTGGEALEEYAAGRAKRDLTALASHAPRTAHLLTSDAVAGGASTRTADGGPDAIGTGSGAAGGLREVPVDDVQVGDLVLVRPGEVVPCDGLLRTGAGVFDDSSLTGESLPQERTEGDVVYSGAVNGAAAVTIEVTRRAADSQLQRIVALVEEAAASRAPMVRLADRYALGFTAVALTIAGAAWWISGEPLRFAQVLVVATPCPLIIGAPVAFMAGMSRAARRGAIIRSSATLEKLHRARVFAFDKTGTLTRGVPAVVDLRGAAGCSGADLLRLAAGAEQASAHPLAAAIVASARTHDLALDAPQEVTETLAGGVSATVDGRAVVVGKRDFVARALRTEVPVPALAPGELAVHVAADGAYAGCVVLRDEVRPDAATTLERVRADGVQRVLMLTGDEEATARHIAAGLGIDDVRAGCLPVDKVDAVRALVDTGGAGAGAVVMVGDGVNDAPVLAAADVGIAMAARGSTAATESADIVILTDELGRVADALEIGRHTVQVALQSVWIGITVSVALMLVATTGALPAVVGAWLQEAVDVIAIAWALRAMGPGALRRWRRQTVAPAEARPAATMSARPA